MNQTPDSDEPLAPVSFLPWVRQDEAGPGAAQPASDELASDEPAAVQLAAVPPAAVPPAAVPPVMAGPSAEEAVSEADHIEHDRVERIVLNSLRRRGLSEWEVTEILRANEVPSEAWHEWIERLRLLGYLNDAQLAEQLVQTHHGRKGLGRQAVARELKSRHIPQDVIDVALEVIDADEEQERATELALKRAGQLSSYDNATATRRLTGFLLRKGYSSDVMRHAIDTAMADRLGKRGTGGASRTVQFR